MRIQVYVIKCMHICITQTRNNIKIMTRINVSKRSRGEFMRAYSALAARKKQTTHTHMHNCKYRYRERERERERGRENITYKQLNWDEK